MTSHLLSFSGISQDRLVFPPPTLLATRAEHFHDSTTREHITAPLHPILNFLSSVTRAV